jgi:hypothetical protein
MDLSVLLDPLDLPRLATVLDELGHLGRVDTIHGWDRDTMARLYEAAQGFRKVTLDDYVPPSAAPLAEVIHHGKNSLPAFTHFQKRFCKPPEDKAHVDGKAVLFGYNHQAMTPFTGPGYYVSYVEGDEVFIDYTKIPPAKPDTWPPIAPNEARLGRFVYAGMIDIMRGISSHVSIGRAKKKGEMMDAWFVLCRQDPDATS